MNFIIHKEKLIDTNVNHDNIFMHALTQKL